MNYDELKKLIEKKLLIAQKELNEGNNDPYHEFNLNGQKRVLESILNEVNFQEGIRKRRGY